MVSLTLIVLVCLSGGLWAGANAQVCCPDGWIKDGSRCFKYFSTPADFVTAEASCIKNGGNLVSIRSKAEVDLIRLTIQRITGTHTRIWTGGYDAIKEGVWMWTDGSKFNINAWAPLQPDNFKSEHCLELNWKNALNDHTCATKKPYLCSLDLAA